MIHLHAHSFFLIDIFLEIKSIRVFQMANDAASLLVNMIPALQIIHGVRNPLSVKGQFDMDEIKMIAENLVVRGFLYIGLLGK